MSRLDDWASRVTGFGVYDTPSATTSAAATVVVEAGQQAPALTDTTFADTAQEVEAQEGAVVDRLAELTEGRLSPLEACRRLFNPAIEEATDVA